MLLNSILKKIFKEVLMWLISKGKVHLHECINKLVTVLWINNLRDLPLIASWSSINHILISSKLSFKLSNLFRLYQSYIYLTLCALLSSQILSFACLTFPIASINNLLTWLLAVYQEDTCTLIFFHVCSIYVSRQS